MGIILASTNVINKYLLLNIDSVSQYLLVIKFHEVCVCCISFVAASLRREYQKKVTICSILWINKC